jgi:protein tyrosine/serine phosphatase
MTRSTPFGIPLAVDAWRDLGGIRTSDGRTIRPGALVRARSLDDFEDWTALHELGVRTLIDLRNDDERASAPSPPGIATLHLPLDGSEDREFWDEWAANWHFGTPVYYAPHVARFPERSLAVLEAIAHAAPGGVLFHCMGGRDRTGMIAMLTLTLVGVPAEAVADDYELSISTSPEWERIAAGYESAGTTARAEVLRAIAEIDLAPFEDLRAALCARVLGDDA